MTTNADAASYETPRLVTWRRWTDAPLVVIAVGTLPLLLLELARYRLVRADRLLLDVASVVVLLAFGADFGVELVLSSDRRRYVRQEWLGLVIVVAQAAALVPALTGVGALRALRAGRVVAILVALGGTHGRATLRRHAASLALGTAGLVWLTSAVVFTLVEDVGAEGRVHSFFDALWWSTTTITTVGYGDIFPVTTAGRITAGVTMLVGISAFAVLTAKVAELLVRSDRAE